jgi:Kef-type K+ transport system membrane component KefB
MTFDLATDTEYVLLMVGLFFVAKYLQRFRLPGAITSLGIGVGFGLGANALQNDPVINIFALLGISILFLFAGMEFDVDELRADARVLAGHVTLQVVAIGATAWAAYRFLDLALRPALLVALALMSPSAGFILDSLAKLGVSDRERVWIKSRAIATEIVALVILLFALQSTSGLRLLLSLLALAAMVMLLPFAFRWFASFVLPHAPKTEFAFLVTVALVCAAITKKLGVYYLVGAFVVGMTEQRLRRKLPGLADARLMHAVELFAAFFIPFYFLKAGLGLRANNFALDAALLGGTFLVAAVPLRILLVVIYRRVVQRQPAREGVRLGVSQLPTLVFTIVVAEILRDRFSASPALVGGLVIYTLANTLVPGVVLHTPLEEYECPEAPDDPTEAYATATPSEVSTRTEGVRPGQ